MPNASPFSEDWRDCLRAHYQHVVRTQDASTEHTLIEVLHQVGFDDREVAELRVLATLRADEAPDFVPDLDALTEQMLVQMQPPEPEPAVYPAAAAPEAGETYDTNGDELPPAEAEPAAAGPPAEPPEDPPDYRAEGPQQMSLF